MDRKKSKLTISGNPKKSIDNIELAKSQNKNSVVIEKKRTKFSSKGKSNKSFNTSSSPNPKPEFRDKKPSSFKYKFNLF